VWACVLGVCWVCGGHVCVVCVCGGGACVCVCWGRGGAAGCVAPAAWPRCSSGRSQTRPVRGSLVWLCGAVCAREHAHAPAASRSWHVPVVEKLLNNRGRSVLRGCVTALHGVVAQAGGCVSACACLRVYVRQLTRVFKMALFVLASFVSAWRVATGCAVKRRTWRARAHTPTRGMRCVSQHAPAWGTPAATTESEQMHTTTTATHHTTAMTPLNVLDTRRALTAFLLDHSRRQNTVQRSHTAVATWTLLTHPAPCLLLCFYACL
jgi:hypothetical protein